MGKKRNRSLSPGKDVIKMQQELKIVQQTREYLKSSGKCFSELSPEKQARITTIFRTARYYIRCLNSYQKLTHSQERLLEVSCKIISYKWILKS